MKRFSVLVVAAAALTVALSGCGGSEESTDANGLRKGNTSTVAATTTQQASTSVSAPSSAESESTPASTPASAPAGDASSVTCGEFRVLDTDSEKALIERILAENPDSKFAGSPNVALGTAKLVCLASSNANKTVAEAAGILAGS
ncbi:hypothetical protein ACTD5D_04950 [Nocardia takedensis]|uniref:hypothetical protein n=1 Tax=Nocardia takedensis TaxID=259390 RepID=UPI0002E4635C|nr:hypothetical protein [Nocardia takedensis]